MSWRRSAWWAAPAALALAGAAAVWLPRDEGRGPQAPAPVYTDWSFSPYAKGEPLAAVQHNADAARTADQARARVQQVLAQGSLRGSDLDGDWGRWAEGRLLPSLSLRLRFDYLLTALGETNPGDLRHWIEDEVTAQMNAGAARQVLAVWDRYLTLQQQAFRLSANPADPSTWQPALAERANARQAILGREWAAAFYTDEEAAFALHTEQVTARRAKGGKPAADAGTPSWLVAPANASPAQAEQLHAARVQELGAAGAERLRAEDAAWADWERRLNDARLRLQALASAPELSAPQRLQAQEEELAQRFAGSELVRARALLLSR
jgi:lipase chaperone LimK